MATEAPTPPVVAVAFSGGRDSLALLHATCVAAQALGMQVLALHVHHGLLPEADDWLRQAQRLCDRWRRRGWPVALRWRRLTGQPAAGDSLEAWARFHRYAALSEMATDAGASLVLLAQHRQDQAETVLLQALRGAGPAGLSAMPRSAERHGLRWVRPWLDQPRSAIEAYVRRHRLRPVEDPSNSDPALARSRLRTQVWAPMQRAFPEAEISLAKLAQRAQEASAVLAEVAAEDLARVADAAGLDVAAWCGLSAARQCNALRAWLSDQPGVLPSDALVQRLGLELPQSRSARWPAGMGTVLRLYRGRLVAVVPHASAAAAADPVPPLALSVRLDGADWVPLPQWGGSLEVTAAASRGLPRELLTAVTARARLGGEQFVRSPGGLPRSLKKQFQAAGIPTEHRQGPLLWAGERLLFVPGLGIDARCWAPPGAPQWSLRWCPGDDEEVAG